jgi:glycosyltransferase involved in cell wall biosynthesis
MPRPERSVLHVLPHPGGGGETYVDVLRTMPGYRVGLVYVSTSHKPTAREVGRGVREVWRRASEHDLLHVNGETSAGLFLPLLARRPSLVTLHGLHFLRRSTGVARHFAALNLRVILRAATRTVCVSNAELAELASVVGPVGMRRAAMIHNGVQVPGASASVDRTGVRRELGIADGELVGIWVGSLDDRRDPACVVRAAERTGTTVLVAGDGPLRPDVERATRSHVRILGNRGDVPRLLAAADFFVLMSHREGLSFALLEAMAHGLPAIVADIPENLEAIGDSGIAVPYADEDEVADAMRRLAGERHERAALGQRARCRAATLFQADRMIDRTRALYDDAFGKPSSRSYSL